MEKTPVMLLQEVSIKQGYVPLYTIISSNNSSHENIFTYKVTVNGESATGTAPNKKLAKHKAASEMLKKTLGSKLTTSTDMSSTITKQIAATISSVSNSYSQETPSFVNNIGMLQEFCIKDALPDPVYTIVNMNESLIPLFKATCVVSSISAEATANNKKQAKQEAAKKVLHQIKSKKNLLPGSNPYSKVEILALEPVNTNLAERVSNLKIDESATTMRAISYYNSNIQRIKSDCKPLIDNSVSNYHMKLKQEYDKKIPDAMKRSIIRLLTENIHLHEDCTFLVNYLSKIFGNLIERKLLRTVKEGTYMVGFRVSICYPIISIGIACSEREAEKEAALNMLHTILRIMA